MASQRAIKAWEALERCVNCMGNGGDMAFLVNEFGRMHRTLQQSMVGSFVIPVIRKCADMKKHGMTDPRNQVACEMAEVMWDALVSKFPYLDKYQVNLPLI